MKPNFGIIVLLALVLFPSASWAQVSTDVKVVFLKGTTLLTANADGSNVQTLVSDRNPKTDLRWSPVGDRIVYYAPSQDASTTDNLVAVTASGQVLKTIPADAGTNWDFSIDKVGWYGEGAIFVTGAVNPYGDDYLAFDLNSGQMVQNLGEPMVSEYVGFETCSSNAQVAYPVDTRASSTSSPSVTLQVNGTTVYTAQPPSTVSSYLLYNLRWSEDCSRIAFIESVNANDTLVVLSGTTVEARVPIPDAGWPVTTVVPLGSSFAVLGGTAEGRDYSGDTTALFYSTTTHTLDPASAILQQLQAREAAENKLMQKLGGSSPDWYRSSP
ncbi:MAG: hypothetical protein ACRD5K_07345 [Candidatus Acidiferrales bacterium]